MRTSLIHVGMIIGLWGFLPLDLCRAQVNAHRTHHRGEKQAAWLSQGEFAEHNAIETLFAAVVFDPALLTMGSDSARAKPRKRNPTGAMLRSLFLPGWGQLYNGQYLKAAVAIAAETGLVATAIYWNQQAVKAPPDSHQRLMYQQNRNTAYWFLAGTILVSMLDAYVDAHLSDFDESPELSIAPTTGSLAVRVNMEF